MPVNKQTTLQTIYLSYNTQKRLWILYFVASVFVPDEIDRSCAIGETETRYLHETTYAVIPTKANCIEANTEMNRQLHKMTISLKVVPLNKKDGQEQ